MISHLKEFIDELKNSLTIFLLFHTNLHITIYNIFIRACQDLNWYRVANFTWLMQVITKPIVFTYIKHLLPPQLLHLTYHTRTHPCRPRQSDRGLL